MSEMPDSPFAPLRFAPLSIDPNVLIVHVEPTAKGNSYRHASNFQEIQRATGYGWSVLNLVCFYNDSDRVHAVYGPEWTPFPIYFQITHGIFRAILVSPEGVISRIEEDTLNEGIPKQGLRPTRGLIVPANYQWALQGLTRLNCFSAYCTRIGNKHPEKLDKQLEPFTSWYENTPSNPAVFRQDRLS
jgi:hypothetical protein